MATAELTELEIHPLALLFPPMGCDEMIALVEDIRQSGLRDDIVLYEGMVLDGRNRYEACRQAGVEPRFVDWDGEGTALDYVVSKNLNRRHLDESQRGYVAARIAELSGTSRKKSAKSEPVFDASEELDDTCDKGSIEPLAENGAESPISEASEPITTEQAAALLNVSKATTKRARKVIREGGKKLNEAVQSGEVSVADAAAIADRPEAVQEEAVEAVKAGKSRTAREAAETISPRPKKPRKPSSNAGKPDLSKLYKAFDKSFGETLRSLDDIANAVGDDKFVKAVRENLAFTKTKMSELKRAHR